MAADPLLSPEPTRATALVLTAVPQRYEAVFAPALRIATGPDGERLVPRWLDTRRRPELATDDELDALERGAVVLVDLEGLGPRMFELAAWYARAGGGRVLLLRCGTAALPFELREHAVLPLPLGTPQAEAAARRLLAERATVAGALPSGVPGDTPAAWAARQRRRERTGVSLSVRLAASLLLLGEAEPALGRLDAAVAAERDAADLLVKRALLRIAVSAPEQAAVDLGRATALAPDYAPAWRELGLLRRQLALPGAEEALLRAVDLSEDYAALVALSGLRGLEGDRSGALLLLERAAEVSGGQWNLALPIALARAAQERSLALSTALKERLQEVRRLRTAQARAEPPADMPWSAWDAALCALLLGDVDDGRALATHGRGAVHAAWEVDPFATALEQLAEAGLAPDALAAVRAAAGVVPRRRREAPAAAAAPSAPAGPPFLVAARDAAWFAQNVPCSQACPVGTDAGTYVTLAAHGRDEDAYRTARAPNPFASACGRVCAAPCESACRRGTLDAPVAIRALKRYLTERHGPESGAERLTAVMDGSTAPGLEGEACVSVLTKRGHVRGHGARVAVVGGGPAGLACAHDLAFLGYRVTVFEASDVLGGMMRHGIPEHRLPRDVLDREIEAILRLGVEVRLSAGLDQRRSLASLRAEGYEAVFLASGAGRGRDLDVEGAGLDGVVRAIDFLINANRGFRMDLGRRVVVVGGGNVAIDVARTARRGTVWTASLDTRAAAQALGPALPGDALRLALGGAPREVHIVARPALGSWPAQEGVHGREEVEEARREGIALHPLRGVRRILGREGRVVGVELAEVVRLTDEHGHYAPAYGPHVAETLACDAVLLAVGQEPDLAYLEGTAGLERTRGGLIATDPATLATRMDGVFAGGDAAFGPRTLIEAVAEGKRAARSIHARLAGPRPLPSVHRFEDLHPRAAMAHPAYDALARQDPPCEPLDRRTGIAEVELGFTEAQARQQAARCLACHVQTVYDGDLCVACGRCVDVCPEACLSLVALGDVRGADADTLAWLAGDGAPEAARTRHGDRPSAMLKDEERCIRCGLCAERCPTGAMTLERYGMNVTTA